MRKIFFMEILHMLYAVATGVALGFVFRQHIRKN